MRRFAKALGIGFLSGALTTLLSTLTTHGFHFSDWPEHFTQIVIGGIAGTILVLKQPPV